MIFWRSLLASLPHVPLNAAFAAATASSTSSSPAQWTSSVTIESLAGFRTVQYWPDLAGTYYVWWSALLPQNTEELI
jgi:hypothetical protein